MRARHPIAACWLALCAALIAGGESRAAGFDHAAFEAWLDALGGRDAPRLYAYAGTAYDVPSGRVLAIVDGYQQARVFRGESSGNRTGRPDRTHRANRAQRAEGWVVRRAFLLYRDAANGEIRRIYPDVRASRTTPPLSITRYLLEGDAIRAFPASGTRGAVQSMSVPETLEARREGAQWVFRRVMTPPNPLEQPVEIQEAVVRRGRDPDGERIRWVMTKVANNTDFLPAGGRHLLHLVWRPVARWEDLPSSVRDFMDREAPGMKSLPASLAASREELGLREP